MFLETSQCEDDTLEDSQCYFNSFGFDGMEVASFTCDETWNQEEFHF
jgi:hypothetical protein